MVQYLTILDFAISSISRRLAYLDDSYRESII
jgi:hypothetical protein